MNITKYMLDVMKLGIIFAVLWGGAAGVANATVTKLDVLWPEKNANFGEWTYNNGYITVNEQLKGYHAIQIPMSGKAGLIVMVVLSHDNGKQVSCTIKANIKNSGTSGTMHKFTTDFTLSNVQIPPANCVFPKGYSLTLTKVPAVCIYYDFLPHTYTCSALSVGVTEQ